MKSSRPRAAFGRVWRGLLAGGLCLSLAGAIWSTRDARGRAEEPRWPPRRSTTSVTRASTPTAEPRDFFSLLDKTEPSAADCQVFRGGHCADPRPHDYDADGFLAPDDCNDRNFQVRPGARDVQCNDVDEDCDGRDLCPADEDEDGARSDIDCDDDDELRHPKAREIPCNGVDEDCSGHDFCDRDGDRVPSASDCDDANSARNPLATDVHCDGIDQDCDGHDCCGHDADGDGASCSEDCDDKDSKVYPGRPIERFEHEGCVRRDLDCDGHIDGTNCL